MTFLDYLIVGSYLFTVGIGWKMLAMLSRIQKDLAYLQGTVEGWELDERVTRLERKVFGGSE